MLVCAHVGGGNNVHISVGDKKLCDCVKSVCASTQGEAISYRDNVH